MDTTPNVVTLYESGLSLRTVAERVGLSQEGVRKALQSLGIKARRQRDTVAASNRKRAKGEAARQTVSVRLAPETVADLRATARREKATVSATLERYYREGRKIS